MISIKQIRDKDSVSVGSGLIALDVILNGKPTTPAKLCAGGSCGNVLSILSFLGWEAKPIGRLAENKASEKLLQDLSNFKVNTSLISISKDGNTPIIIHRILVDKDGNPKHKFEFRIPETNQWLPMYKPVLASSVNLLTDKQPTSNIFYFDRVSRSSINLATYYKSRGALVIFEPSSYKFDNQFKECLEVADIIKFSSDRINNYSEIHPEAQALLEIETFGKDGLKYRLKSDTVWKSLPSFNIQNVKDSAGAGDWCTAGIINELGYDGINSFKAADVESIERALKIGQVFGSINCEYDGARGVMYNMDYNSFVAIAEARLNKTKLPIIKNGYVEITTISNFKFESIL